MLHRYPQRPGPLPCRCSKAGAAGLDPLECAHLSIADVSERHSLCASCGRYSKAASMRVPARVDARYLQGQREFGALLCRCGAKAESLHQLRCTLGDYARDKRPNAPTTGLMPVSLRSAADVANTLARQPDAALMDIWGLDAMAVQYLLMDSINRVLVQCKASRTQWLAQPRLWLCWKAELAASCKPVLLVYASNGICCQ